MSFIVLTLSATLNGSSSSRSEGFPVLTSQKPQALVQVSPMIIKVAVPIDQHSYIFGHEASSQTVFSFFSFIKFFSSIYSEPRFALTFIHSGLFGSPGNNPFIVTGITFLFLLKTPLSTISSISFIFSFLS